MRFSIAVKTRVSIVFTVCFIICIFAKFSTSAVASVEDDACKGMSVVLTFDDGPHNTNTPDVMKALTSAGTDGQSLPATFFVTGNARPSANSRVDDLHLGGLRGDKILDMIAENPRWLIGNHTKRHGAALTTLKDAEIKNEISYWLSEPHYKKALLAQKSFMAFRAPYGAYGKKGEYSGNVLRALHGAGYDFNMFWDLDSDDWAIDRGIRPYQHLKGAPLDKRKQALIARIKEQLQKECKKRTNDRKVPIVVLFHDIKDTTAAALPEILSYMKSVGVEFKGLNEVEKFSEEAWIATHKDAPKEPSQSVLVEPRILYKIENSNGRTNINRIDESHDSSHEIGK